MQKQCTAFNMQENKSGRNFLRNIAIFFPITQSSCALSRTRSLMQATINFPSRVPPYCNIITALIFNTNLNHYIWSLVPKTAPSSTITHPIPKWHPFCHSQILSQTQPFTNIKHHIPHMQDGDEIYMEGTQTAYLKRQSYGYKLKEQEPKILL